MISIQGKGVSVGVAAGPLCFYRRAQGDIRRYSVEDREAEWQRFKQAQAQAVEQLGALAEKTRRTVGDDMAALFETHQLMAEDLDYEAAVQEGICGEGRNAEAVVFDVSVRFAGMFAAMDNAYMRSRSADVKDVSRRILAALSGVDAPGGIHSDVPVILAADDLAPSETAQLDKEKILALVTVNGSGTSHTAILARTLGIPAVTGAEDLLKSEYAGREVIVDGSTGAIYIDADEATRAQYLRKREEQLRRRRMLVQLKGKESVTKDGQRVRICCNIGSPGDLASVLENDGDGIGLFRSEYLYLGRDTLPSEEEQFEAYRSVLSGMNGREVVIRTLDVGADKQLDALGLPPENNPAMGNRAIRICLDRPTLFRTQLRALYRASVFGQLAIMLPMITSVWEVREVKSICASVCEELRREGIPYSDEVRLGIMIETPAAAVISDRLAREVDFFSCGTNDLTQYTLACDRQNGSLARYYEPSHPAVLRLIKLAADNAHKNGIWIGVCGDLAADPEMAETFLSIGIDELSVPALGVLPLRDRVREIDLSACRETCLRALLGEEEPE